jgi:hypothetical protein
MTAGRARRTSGAACVDAPAPANPAAGHALQAKLDHAHAQAAAALADEKGTLVRGGQPGALRGPGRHRFPRLAADRNDAQLVALAEDANLAGEQVFETGNVERSKFGETQAGRVEEFEHRLVAHLAAGISGATFEQAVCFIGRQNALGSALGLFGGRTLSTGLWATVPRRPSQR